MFKSARRKSEKNKLKAVFKLQFHATQVPQFIGDALMISVVPADVGKPTARLGKTAVRDGSCHWESPVQETVKFVREPKTGKIHERIYHFIVSTGSSKAGLLGEVSIDFANYAEATKPSSMSLPLKNAKSEAVLHVLIQRTQENVDQREAEENDNAKSNSHERSLKSQLTNCDTDASTKSSSTEDVPFNKTISQIAKLNVNCRTSSVSDVTMSSSGSSSGLDTTWELGLKNNNVHQDPTSFISSMSHVSMPQKPSSDASTTIYEEHQGSQWEWLGSSAPEVSTDESSSSPRETLLREGPREASDTVIENLKTEIAVLARQAEVSELELQTLRKQIVKDRKRGLDLSEEVFSLKEERDTLKDEFEKLKAFQKHMNEARVANKLQFEGGDLQALLEELRQELKYEKDLNANLQLQLQKTQESNSDLILAVQDLDEILEKKNREVLNFSNRSAATSENTRQLREIKSQSETDDDEEQKALEELVKKQSDASEAHVLEQKIMDLYGELKIYRRDKDDVEMQMEQLALDYEILKQENHDLSYKLKQSQLQEQLKMQYECSYSYATLNELETQIENLENELKKQSKEYSESLATINELETHVKSLEEEMENQAQGFEADLEALTHAKVEQEQRAILAEEALRKTRWQNSNTAERLQEEFRRLSVQMVSTFEANEKLATKALTEGSELHLQKSHLEEMLLKAKEELQSIRDYYDVKMHEFSSQISSKACQIDQMQSEIENKSRWLEHHKKQEEETHGILSQEILVLRAEVERLTTDNNNLSKEAEKRETLEVELNKIKASMEQTEMLIQRRNLERNEMESTIALVRKEEEYSRLELNNLRSLGDEKEAVVENLQSELETLKAQCNELKHSLSEDELEKEKLRKLVFQLKSDLRKNEDAFNSIEKQLKESNYQPTASDGMKATSGNDKFVVIPHSSREVADLKEKIKLLETQVKLKENALETFTNSFLEKEKNLHDKIGELEETLEEFHQNSESFCEKQKVAKDTKDNTLNGSMLEGRNMAEQISTTACIFNTNRPAMLSIKSNDGVLSEKEMEASSLNTRDQRNPDEILSEMALLKEMNKAMEGELKEMQERYSEISLKFAEVEGERQQLLMRVRSLKNAKKS